MAKYARRKNRDGDKIRLAPRCVVNKLAQRHLGDVVLTLEHAGEHAGHVIRLGGVQLKALDADLAAMNRQRTVVSTAREFDLNRQRHGRCWRKLSPSKDRQVALS